MPTSPFDAWFKGSPNVATPKYTGNFGFWFKGSPNVQPVIVIVAGVQGFGCRARIVSQATQVIQARCRIAARSTQTFQLRCRIAARATQTFSSRTRICIKSTQTLQSRARICVPTTQHLQSRARIAGRSTQAWQSKARICVVTHQTWSGRAHISTNQTNQSMDVRANILSNALPGNTFGFRARANINSIPRQYSVDVRARIKPKVVVTEDSRMRVQRTQGWPPYNTGDPGAAFFTDTSLRVGASITAPTQSKVSVSSKANIIHISTWKLTTKADVILNSRIQIGALIAGRQSSGTFPCGFYIANQQTRDLVGTYSYPGAASSQSMGIGASIVRQHSDHVINQYALPAKPAIINRVQVITLSGSDNGQQVLGIGAFIQR